MSARQYTVYQVADLLGSTPGEVLSWVREGRLACRGEDGQQRVSQAALVRFLKSEGIDIEQVLAKAVLEAAVDVQPVGAAAPPAPRHEPPVVEEPRLPADDDLRKLVDARKADADAPSTGDGEHVADVVPRAAEGPRQTDDRMSAPAAEPPLDAEIVAADPAEGLAQAILKDAVARRATAIHLDPMEGGGLSLRLRVDGALQEKVNFRLRLPPAIAQGLVAHLLKRAGLPADGAVAPGTTALGTTGVSPVGPPPTPDPAGERSGWFTAPDFGELSRAAGAGDVRFRLSVCPTRAGRRLVIFVTDADADRPALQDLGLASGDLQTLRRLLRERSGLVLVTARPGGEATTTLRAMAGELVSPHRSIFWIGPEERPPVVGASLIPLARDGAAEAIRLAEEQDPDLIAVSEIWDSQALLAAAEAALAGRLVLARVYERTAPAALELLRKAGLPPSRLATALLAVIAQTTVRKLCPACRKRGQEPFQSAKAAEPRSAGHSEGDEQCENRDEKVPDPFLAFVPVGCKQCYGTGYAGRTGVFSILEVTDELASLLRDGASAPAISEAAAKAGMRALPQAATDLARRGDTSLEELARGLLRKDP